METNLDILILVHIRITPKDSLCHGSFWMGLDCRDVCHVIHVGAHDDVESYI